MSASLHSLVPELRPFAIALVDVAGRAGLQPRVTSARRSHAEQARLYRRYLAGQNPYPVAPPGTSAHEFGFAFDLAITPMADSNLADLGKVWTGWGGVWGGQFDDPIHFELPGFPHSAVQKANIVQKAADAFGGLPWWSTLPLPLASLTKADSGQQIRDKLNSVFGWHLT